MDFTRLQCEHLPKRAGMTLTAAIELLNTPCRVTPTR